MTRSRYGLIQIVLFGANRSVINNRQKQHNHAERFAHFKTHTSRTCPLVAVEDDADVNTDEYEGEDDAGNAEDECKVRASAGLSRPHLGRHAVSSRDGGTALGRAQNGEDANQPTTAQRHEDRVAHVVFRWILQWAHRLHDNQHQNVIIVRRLVQHQH